MLDSRPNEKDFLYETLAMEYNKVSEAIVSTDSNFSNVLNIPIIIFSGVLVYGFTNTNSDKIVFLFLPLVTFIYIHHILKYTIKLFKYGGYRRYLEERLNHLCGKKILFLESILEESGSRFFNGGFLVVFFFGSIAIVSVYLSITTAYILYGLDDWRFFAALCFNFISIVSIMIMIFVIATTFNKSYLLAKKKYESLNINDDSNIVLEIGDIIKRENKI